MLLLPPRFRWSKDNLPDGPLELDPDFPYIQNLKLAYFFHDRRKGYNLVDGIQATVGSSPVTNAERYGWCESLDSNYDHFDTNIPYSGNEWTLLIFQYPRFLPSGGTTHLAFRQEDNLIRFGWDHSSSSQYRGSVYFKDAGGTYRTASFNVISSDIGKWGAYVGRAISGTGLWAFKNGRLKSETLTSGTFRSPSGDMQLGSSSSKYLDTNLSVCCVWNAALPDELIFELSQNPFIVLHQPRWWIPGFVPTGSTSVLIDTDTTVTSTESLTGGHIISVDFDASALSSIESILGEYSISVYVSSEQLAALESLLGSFVISVNRTPNVLSDVGALTGNSIVSVLQDSNFLSEAGSLEGAVSIGGAAGVSITASPLVSTESVTGQYVLSVYQTAQALSSIGSVAGYQGISFSTGSAVLGTTELLAGQHVISARISAAYLDSVETITASSAGSVSVIADALEAAESIAGQEIIGVLITADSLVSVESMSALPIISVVVSADSLMTTESILGIGIGAGPGSLGSVQIVALVDNLDETLVVESGLDYRIFS